MPNTSRQVPPCSQRFSQARSFQQQAEFSMPRQASPEFDPSDLQRTTRVSRMTPLIETTSVQVDYPHSDGVLRLYDDGVSLVVNQGDFTAVLGALGWGKSTLINLILGLEKPTRSE